MNDDERLCLIIFVTWSILMFCPETRQCNYRPQQVCECGRSQQYQYSRIVNGQQVRPHVYPWVALLLSKNKAVCGGSVINNYYVLSAGHCKQQQEKVTDFTVALGVHDRITMDDGQARIYNVIKIIVHPDYEELKFRNDIALFKLHKEIKFDFFVRPICLPYRGEDFTGRSAIVTGWGTKRFGKTYRDRFLQQVTLIVLSEDECAQSEMRSSYTNHSKLMLCAYENGVDACKECECGRLRKFYGNMTETATTPHEYPWTALLLTNDGEMAYCGGSIINSYYILTTASCVVYYEVSQMKVALGVRDRAMIDSDVSARIYRVAEAVVHPQHVDREYYHENDVALLKTNQAIEFNYTVAPVCLPYKNEDFTRRTAVVSGWGRKYENVSTDLYLQITVDILPSRECLMSNIVGELYGRLQNQLLCAYQRNADSCQGDTGGPLLVKVDENITVQVGMVSTGKLCGEPSMPGAYVSVTYYIDWILNETKNAAFCRKPVYNPIIIDG